jgi:mannose-1-phosphate guanylyltransferase
MNEHFYAAIMAGGGGTRLWPLSRRNRPKQSLNLFGDRTLFQIAVDRIKPVIPIERIVVMTGQDQVALLREQCPDIPAQNYLIEPAPRGTAAAIGLAAVHIQSKDPDGTMACLTADHYIKNEAEFRDTLLGAMHGAYAGGLFTLGIQPDTPDPSYGYIHMGAFADEFAGHKAYIVEAFTEKPDADLAREYIESGEYLWNSGMFFWRTDAILGEMKRQLPRMYESLRSVQKLLGKKDDVELITKEWMKLQSTTIDYGVMEGAENVYVIPAADFGWIDVGDWGRLFNILAKDPNDVITSDDDPVFHSSGTMVIRSEHSDPEKIIALLGVEDLVIVETKDVLLVCKRESAEQVKSLVEQLKSAGMDKYL